MKIKVEKLANIKEAEVEVKNLTLFVGQNSTHKSYMAHVIYELYKELSSFNHPWIAKRIKVTRQIATKVINLYLEDIDYLLSLTHEKKEREETFQFTEDDLEHQIFTDLKFQVKKDDVKIKNFIANIKNTLLQEITKIINSSFNTKKEIIEKFSIISIDDLIDYDDTFTITFDIQLETLEFNYENIDQDIKFKLINKIIDKLLNIIIKELNGYKYSYYFPASRTGFVLTLDEIYAGIFRDKFRGQISATRLGEPTIDFIQTFADIKTGINEQDNLFNFSSTDSKKTSSLISFLEEHIIKGRIHEEKNEQNYTNYYLNINKTKLDLHLASSATLETLPFIVFLKNTKDIKKTIFVIEEPEAHLHPKAQIQMARFLVLLSKSGAKVLVTTHSDYILGEINNCIKTASLHEHYDFSIDKDNITAYLFKNTYSETKVCELTIDKYGIANDNFDEVLDELLDRSNELNEKIEENDI